MKILVEKEEFREYPEDVTPIIYLGKIGSLLLLKQLYERVYVPDTVWKKLVTPLTDVWAEIPEDISEIRVLSNPVLKKDGITAETLGS